MTKAGFAPTDHDLAADAGEAVIRLAPGGVITGRVDERGGPIVGGTVRVRPVCAPACTDAGGGAGPFAVETDDRGVYRLGSLPAAHYEVHLAPSRFTATMTPAVAVAGPGTSVVDGGEPLRDGRSGPASLVVATGRTRASKGHRCCVVLSAIR